MNPKFEKRFAIVALLVISGVTSLLSYSYTNSDSLFASSGSMGSSIFEKISTLLRYVIYGTSVFLIIARIKKVVIPFLRDPFLWGLMVVVLTSFLWSDFPDISFKNGLLTLMTTLVGVYFASRYSIKEQIQLFAWAFGIAVVFSFLYTLALPGNGIEQGLHQGAWRGPFIHKNLFARFLVACTPPLLIVALNNRKKILWAVFGLTFTSVLLTTSKTGLIIFISLVTLFFLYRMLQTSSEKFIPVIILVILAISGVATWLSNNWSSFILSLGKDETLSGRTEIWQMVTDKIHLQPWLGYGYESFWLVGGQGDDLIKYGFLLRLAQAHNGYLDIIANLGLIGAGFFLLSLITAYIRALIAARASGQIEDLWPLAYITFLLMYNQTETTIVETNSLFWMLYVAVTLSIKRGSIIKADMLWQTSPKTKELAEQI